MARDTGIATVTIKADTSGIDRFISGLGNALTEHAAAVAAAGAKVVYDEVKKNVGQIGRKSGNLDRSIYRVLSESKSNRAAGKVMYHVSWNYRKAPHGRLLEWGWWQRYQTLTGKNGQWYTAVRPGMKGKKKPSRRASQAVKDAYYVPLAGGPKFRPGFAFLRRAQSAFPRAVAAMEAELAKKLGQL